MDVLYPERLKHYFLFQGEREVEPKAHGILSTRGLLRWLGCLSPSLHGSTPVTYSTCYLEPFFKAGEGQDTKTLPAVETEGPAVCKEWAAQSSEKRTLFL